MERQRLLTNLSTEERRMLILKIEAAKLFNIVTRVRELIRGLEGFEEVGEITLARLEEAERTFKRFVLQLERRNKQGAGAPIIAQLPQGR